MEKIWTAHWLPGLDEGRIRLPGEPLSVILTRNAQRVPRKPAIVFYGRELTYGALDHASNAFAGWLRRRGVAPGDRVALYLENCPQFAIAYYGALKAGAILVCLNPMHKAIELAHELEDSGARVLQLNATVYLGATLVFLARFDLDTALRAIQDYRCTVTTLIATINVAIVNSPRTRDYDLSSLRLCLSGGAPVPAEIARRWEAITGHKLVEGYGLTETTAPTHCNPPHRPRYGSVGLPLPFCDVKVVSLADGTTELPRGEAGEIAVRGPMVMKGYWRRPEATAEAIRDGWFHTGDIGYVDAEGYFTIVERKKDMIKASGYSVFPAEVEAIMYRHPAIAEVGVVGVADPYRGEDVLAFVVLKPGAAVTEEGLVQWCRQEMAVYKAPRRIRFVSALPKTGSGKILKRALREQARG